ncbi:hypothetical protein Bca52824_085538 [Brassica carinata]|uniref:Uncharacterized protein n=1 Tax=Brassica carinata TaxID=52824 RepID=A0A8X7TKY8_BRACI|nr:hypothetical protein Bca52824_085538 [Brassica carinata]
MMLSARVIHQTLSLNLNEKQEQDALVCEDDDRDQDVEKDITPGQKLGFWVQESKLDTNDEGKVMEVGIDGSSSSTHHLEIEGLDLELRLANAPWRRRQHNLSMSMIY